MLTTAGPEEGPDRASEPIASQWWLWVLLTPGGTLPARDERGVGQARLSKYSSHLFEFRLVQAVGEAGHVAEAVGGLDDRQRVAMYPHSGVGGEGAVAA